MFLWSIFYSSWVDLEGQGRQNIWQKFAFLANGIVFKTTINCNGVSLKMVFHAHLLKPLQETTTASDTKSRYLKSISVYKIWVSIMAYKWVSSFVILHVRQSKLLKMLTNYLCSSSNSVYWEPKQKRYGWSFHWQSL